MTDDALRARIRQLLDEDVLPREEARSVNVHRRRGGTCRVCGVAFEPEESEYEVTTSRGRLLLLHRRCLELWATLVRE
jgi:formamidopyrimidine-DNA glycosylase